MKIQRERLESIIREELANHIKVMLSEAPAGHAITDARKDSTEKDRRAGKEPKKPVEKPGQKKWIEPANPAHHTKQDPTKFEQPPDEPSPHAKAANGDDKDAKDMPASGEEDAADVSGGKISQELVGKSIQSITTDPKSKLMPGAQEIVITFNEVTDPLRILVGKTGMVKFYFKGLHNSV
jgi:hypothetical protein